MTPAGFEPKISAGKRPQTYALDRAATGTGMKEITATKLISILFLITTNKMQLF